MEQQISAADQINETLTPVADFVSSIVFFSIDINGVALPLVVIWLIGAGIVTTVYLRFVNIRGFLEAFRIIRTPEKRTDHPGEITHFQALTAALSGTVGLGNIASVPVAIALGGPGAAFWMVLAGFLGMTTKFVECTLAVKYRRINPDGTVSGGPMYYIEHVFRRMGVGPLGRALAVFFAIMTLGGSMSVFQVNQAHAQFTAATGVSAPLIFGILMSGAVGLVILGGIRSIARVTSRLVPLMAIIYLAAGVIILIVNAPGVPTALWAIIHDAFAPDAVAGGMIGAMIQGIRRATYSSEAGVGSAAIAHSAVKTDTPITEGYVALLEPFTDTVVVSLMTALIIVVTGSHLLYVPGEVEGIQLTSAAYESVFGWFPIILSISAMLFAFSTLVTWAFYGVKAVTYMVGESKIAELIYKIALVAILSTGAAISLSAVIDFIDSMLFAMAAPNIIALYLLLPEVRRDMLAYEKRRKFERG
ncbi:MAG: alanine/glycine:cation symporter family protein [Parvularculaceae bacterium]